MWSGVLNTQNTLAFEYSQNTVHKTYEADFNAPGNAPFHPANTEIKHVPSVILSSIITKPFHPPPLICPSLFSPNNPLHPCRFMHFSLQASLFTADRTEELSFSHVSLMLTFHERKRRVFQATSLSQMPFTDAQRQF